MKKLLPGLLVALVGGLLCRESYARGFNKGVDECKRVVLSMSNDLTRIISKEKENEKEEEAH